MKRNLLFITILLLSFNCNAQQKQGRAFRTRQSDYCLKNIKTIGYSKIRIKYAFQAQDIKNVDTWIDCGQLLASKDMTQYSSFFLFENDEALREWIKKNPKKSNYPNALNLHGRERDYWSEYQYTQIYIKGNELTEWAAMPSAEIQQWRYKEPFPTMKWTLGKEMKTICGYECQKATCHWRGRDYVAWFTQKIPLKSGPWKFGGLPGLIMKIYDTNNLYTWEAVAVENGSFPIIQWDETKFKETTRKKVWEMQRDYNMKYSELAGIIDIRTGRMVTKRFPYDQLELE